MGGKYCSGFWHPFSQTTSRNMVIFTHEDRFRGKRVTNYQSPSTKAVGILGIYHRATYTLIAPSRSLAICSDTIMSKLVVDIH